MFKLTFFQSLWDGILGLTSTKKGGGGGGGSIFCEFLKSLVFCFVVSMHNPETISDLS